MGPEADARDHEPQIIKDVIEGVTSSDSVREVRLHHREPFRKVRRLRHGIARNPLRGAETVVMPEAEVEAAGNLHAMQVSIRGHVSCTHGALARIAHQAAKVAQRRGRAIRATATVLIAELLLATLVARVTTLDAEVGDVECLCTPMMTMRIEMDQVAVPFL